MTTQPSSPRRRIAPRRGLPDGRALLGALLVMAAALGAYRLAADEPADPRRDVVVAARPLEVGHALTPTDLRVAPMVLTTTMAGLSFDEVTEVVGHTVLAPLAEGQLLVGPQLRAPTADIEAAGTAAHELTIPIPPDRTPPGLRPGDRVTVIATDPGAGTPTDTQVALADATVLRYAADGSARSARLTLAVPDAASVLRATDLSFRELTLVRTVGPPGGFDELTAASADPR